MHIIYLLFILISPLYAAEYNCHLLKFNEGCLLSPEGIKERDHLIIYFRGHYGSHKGNIPADLRIASAKQAASYYDLEKLVDKTGIPMFVTGSSHIRISGNDIEVLRPTHSSKITLAAHSGGYVGLLKSLATYKNEKVSKIIMLDNFYFSSSQSEQIRKLIQKGTECTGFYTTHNRSRYQTRFQNKIGTQACPVDYLKNHNSDVNRCLGKYLTGPTCL